MVNKILNLIRPLVPKPILDFFRPAYHFSLAFLAALLYRIPARMTEAIRSGGPSKKLTVIGVTGTKGKSTVVYLAARILENAGFKTAAASSIEFKIGEKSVPNLYKMTMPGRFFLQKFLADAKKAGCRFAVLEVTSEGIKQHRHRFIKFGATVFTNLSPEHVESHGGFENYKKAKLSFFEYAEKIHILNEDDGYFKEFANAPAEKIISYSKREAADFKLKLPGEFNRENAAAAAKIAETFGVPKEIIKKTLESIAAIPGRMEEINEGQNFKVVVDYAHTPDSLEKVYQTLLGDQAAKLTGKLICVFGAAGGGRDKWKRPEMGRIAAKYCSEIILTNEDPYDENPGRILSEIKSGISDSKFPISNVYEILNRKEAIKKSLSSARSGDAVIITGKGCEQWMMAEKGKKIPWDDRKIVGEFLREK